MLDFNWIRKKRIKRFFILLLSIATITTIAIAVVIAVTNPEVTLDDDGNDDWDDICRRWGHIFSMSDLIKNSEVFKNLLDDNQNSGVNNIILNLRWMILVNKC